MDAPNKGNVVKVLRRIAHFSKDEGANRFTLIHDLEMEPAELQQLLIEIRRLGLIDFDFRSVWLLDAGREKLAAESS